MGEISTRDKEIDLIIRTLSLQARGGAQAAAESPDAPGKALRLIQSLASEPVPVLNEGGLLKEVSLAHAAKYGREPATMGELYLAAVEQLNLCADADRA